MSYFHYQKSPRSQARKMLIIAIGFPISFWVMIETFANGKLSSKEELIIYSGALTVSCILLLVFVIPELFRKKMFTYEVTDEYVTCDCPAGESYQLKVKEIVRLQQVKQATGQLWVDEYIETSDGKLYSIPKRYDLDISAVIKAIRLAKPDVVRGNEVRY